MVATAGGELTGAAAGSGGVAGREPASRADWFNGGWTCCGIGTVGATRDIGTVGRADPPGNGGASAEGTFVSAGVEIGAVAAVCALFGKGELARTGWGNRPEGEIRRELEFGAGGGTGELDRTALGIGGMPAGTAGGVSGRGGTTGSGIDPGSFGVNGKTPVGGRGGGTKLFAALAPGGADKSRGTNSSVAGTWLSSMMFGCDEGTGAGVVADFAASACSRKISSVNGSAMLVTAASTAFWSGRSASKSGGMRITTSISGSVIGSARKPASASAGRR